MRKYSRSLYRFDRTPPPKFGVAVLSALAAALLAACAAQVPIDSRSPMAEPEPQPMQAPAAPEAEVRPQPAPVLRPGAPLSYVVKRGDTLWDIANHFLLDPWQWPEIWIVNGQVRNPHLIYPGDVLRLTEVDGRPRLGLDRDLERLSPRIRELPLESAIPTIPIDAIRDFLRSPRLVTTQELETAPYLLAFVDDPSSAAKAR